MFLFRRRAQSENAAAGAGGSDTAVGPASTSSSGAAAAPPLSAVSGRIRVTKTSTEGSQGYEESMDGSCAYHHFSTRYPRIGGCVGAVLE